MVREIVQDGNAQTGLTGLNTTFRIDVPQLFAEVDRTKAKTLGIPLSEVFDTLQAYLGSAYVNDFNKFGRTWQVMAQADHQFRTRPDDIRSLDVRNASGAMVPLGTLIAVEETVGPQTILRYNLYPTASITGEAAPGYSSGQALDLMEQLAGEKLPTSMGYEWTGMSFQEKKVGSEAILVFALAIILVFLVLSAQYESWTSPAAVIMVVPLAVLGTVLAVMMKGADNNVYTQIGITLLIGLASKNAILIVEFAMAEREKGKSLMDAAVDAAKVTIPAHSDDLHCVHSRFYAAGGGVRGRGRQSAGHWPGCGGGDGGGDRHVTDVYTGILCRDEAAGREGRGTGPGGCSRE